MKSKKNVTTCTNYNFFLYLCDKKPLNINAMSKKKGGKRLNKKQIAEMLQTLFQQNPNETFSFKQIFKALKLDTHPTKMLAIDLMEEMAWDDFLSKVSDNSYRLNLKTQVQEGTLWLLRFLVISATRLLVS